MPAVGSAPVRLCLAPLVALVIVALSFITAAPARAAVGASGGRLTSGVAVHPVIAVGGQQLSYTFSGAIGHHVTFDVSATTWHNGTAAGSAKLYVYNPSGGYVAFLGMSSTPTHLDFTPTATGTYTVNLVPDSNSTGSATIKPTF